ncbi:MAG: penicillin-binding protein 2 [Verrucomicrobia bacterium]|nr:penicillin-binding protein 2 [Verrucomicrobiota bacterium]
MLIIDQLKKSDFKLQAVAMAVLAGMAVLLAGLWYLQVVRSDRYRANLQAQSVRTVRVPAIRGKILDRNGYALAENRPSYNVNLYLEELRDSFRHEYTNGVRKEFKLANPNVRLTRKIIDELERQARYRVVSNVLMHVSSAIQEPRLLVEQDFHIHYDQLRSLPLPLLKDLSKPQVALFVEQAGHVPSLALEPQAVRHYPYQHVAAHIVGHLQRDFYPVKDEDISFRFRLPDYVGRKGIEAAFDTELRGKAGVKAVLVNNLAYRESEHTPMPPEPGHNVVLTIDLWIQLAAEKALANAPFAKTKTREEVCGAVAVMDVNTGDIYALASSPSFDPNQFVTGFTNEEYKKMSDEDLRPMFNRAGYGTYPPGSSFKIIVALAGLEAGVIDTNAIYRNPGHYFIGRHRIDDTAPAGDYSFRRAFWRSSNSYFVEHGLRIGPEKIIEMARQFHLGEPTGLWPKQEAAGALPTPGELRKLDGSRWMPGDTGNLSIGHGELLVTPLQMAVLIAAVANGGTLLAPRLIERIEPQEKPEDSQIIQVSPRQVRGTVKLRPETLERVRQAMLDDTQNAEGTGRSARVDGLQIAGKTGTAKLTSGKKESITWFVSYAPFDNPRYAVVVVVEGGASGSLTCAPVARDIYKEILKRDPGILQKAPSEAHAPETGSKQVVAGTARRQIGNPID